MMPRGLEQGGFGGFGGSPAQRWNFGKGDAPPEKPGMVSPSMSTVGSATGGSSSSPLSMWNNWLQTMGPYLAQMPTSQPNAESGGLSSLATPPAQPAPTSTGTPNPNFWLHPWNNRGFNALSA
jgi:hypothetical protein